MIEKLIQTAKNEVGYLEKKTNSQLDSKTANAGSNNYTKYARDLDNISGFYNGKKNGYAWCDVFVDWCFVKTFGVDKAKELLCQPSKSLGAGCQYSYKYYKAKGQTYSSPKKGDQIFFNSTSSNFAHTGLVIDVDKKYVYTIEGNTSSEKGVISNGGCVREKKYKLNFKYIAGYGRPKYDEETPTPTPAPLSVGDKVKIVGTGNGSSYGTSNTAYGIGWTRQILRIWDGRPYPYQVGNNTGTTGFYKADALQRL